MIDPMQLQDLEEKYGGVVQDIMFSKSYLDPRDDKHAGESLITGGDRMQHEAYREMYAQHLPEDPKVFVELGIFKGTGLAIWCDLFPNTRVIGLDINLTHFRSRNWKEKGAFQENEPEVYSFDKFRNNSEFYRNLLVMEYHDRIDVMIDDSAHDTGSIIWAFQNVRPFLADDFVYFIEDNGEVDKILKEKYPLLFIERRKGVTVIKPK